MANMVNVLLHGIFGYRFTQDCIEAYTPAVCGHMYKVGLSRDSSEATELPRMDFELKGVKQGNKPTWPNAKESPVILLPKETMMDEFGKRYSMIRLPYPTLPKKNSKVIWPVDAATLGSIYAGRDATPLNMEGPFPSMHIFSYEQSDEDLQLEPYQNERPIYGAAKAKTIYFRKLKSDKNILLGCINLHIWCTMAPAIASATSAAMETGHLRRGFASLVDLFPSLEITIEIPDGFTPAPAQNTPYPAGVSIDDIDPPPSVENILYGHTNCHFANIMAVPESRAAMDLERPERGSGVRTQQARRHRH